MSRLEQTPDQMTPQLYRKVFDGLVPKPDTMDGVCGRIVRGVHESHFERLSFAEGRRLAWISGSEELLQFVGQPHRDLILGMGKDEAWLAEKLEQGLRWKLIILPAQDCVLADWNGVYDQIQAHYPEISDKLLQWADTLRTADLASQIDPAFVSRGVKDNIHHPDHMSVERYAECTDNAINARLFLWHSLGMNHLFTGTGMTSGGTAEYLTPNKPLSSFRNCELIQLDVR